MKQPTLAQRTAYAAFESAQPTKVQIPGTRRKIKLRELHPGTIEKITQIWIERDLASASIKSGAEVLKDLAKEPYFAFKEAAAYYLNNDIKLRLFWPILWRWWAFRYTESQMEPIIAEGKKKLPLSAHFAIMAYSTDMRTDWMTMTKKEAERYQAEQLLEVRRLSSKTSQPTESQNGGSESGK